MMRSVGVWMSKVTTGIRGLDSMLKGGFPEASVILISGGPGSGKTVLSAQFLYHGATRGEAGIYISLEDSPIRIIKICSSLNWDIKKYADQGLLTFVDASPFEGQFGEGTFLIGKDDPRAFNADTLFEIIKRFSHRNIKRAVFDPITMFTSQFRDPLKRREQILRLTKLLNEAKLTTIFTAEIENEESDHYTPEQYISDGAINLRYLNKDSHRLRAIDILKMASPDFDHYLRPYEITSRGFEVYNTERVH
jgi:KaiC/GvpD/RAD55 family RecA-like ATPase